MKQTIAKNGNRTKKRIKNKYTTQKIGLCGNLETNCLLTPNNLFLSYLPISSDSVAYYIQKNPRAMPSMPLRPYRSTSATPQTEEHSAQTRKGHSLSLSFKNLFVKTSKTAAMSHGAISSQVEIDAESLSPNQSPPHTVNATSSHVQTLKPQLLRATMKPVLAHVAEEDMTDVGFTPLAVPQEAYIPASAPQSRRSSADPVSRRGSVDRASRKGSVDQPSSRMGSVSRSSGAVQYSDEGTLKIYEDGSHEHILKAVKIMEKIPAGSGILSGFLRRNDANGNDAAFSLLPEQNRMDFQRRLSIQSRKTFDEADEDGEQDSDVDSEEEAEGSEDEGEFSLKAAIGDNQLSLINKLVEKINNNEDPSIVEKNYKLTEKYGKPQGIIGKGAYGTVKLVSKIDMATKKEIFYAVKELKQKENEEVSHFSTRLTSEFVISNSLQHLNIVRTVDLMKNSCGIYSEVMEYCAAGDLYNWISKTNREGLHYLEADCFMRQIMNGLSYMHSRGVAHCDIKPENILLTTQGIAKISDFGTSAVFRTAWEKECHFSAGACGSEPYVAPEEFTEKNYDPRCVDVWAVGVLYLTMATGTYLWPAAKLDEPLYEEYIDARPKPGKYSKFEPIENLKSGACFKSRKATLYAMLDPSPVTRITTHQAIKSSWLQQVKLCEAAQDYDIHV